MRLLIAICLVAMPVVFNAQHPVTFFNKAEAALVKKSLHRYPLLARSYTDIKKEVDAWLDKDVDVPFPKDPAGGYTHDRHKANYMLLFNSGVLYNLTGELKYAAFAKKIFLKYAALNPTLKNHPQATSSSPGRIFWQALNDANWLVYAGMAYDLVYNSLSKEERKTIEDGAFKPEVDFLTNDLQPWFDLIHNHGVWACAGVGIVGIATGNSHYVDMALYGTKKDGKSGFLAQINGLFSPDGFYTEGPYYVRYAILPYYLFANALKNVRPQLDIFNYRNKVLQKALMAGLEQTNLDGTFFALNDALKEKDYTTNELVTAVDIAWNVFGKNDELLFVAAKQDKVLLNKGGLGIAAALSAQKILPVFFPYRSVEYTDGVKGDEGGVSYLRNGEGSGLTTLISKYTSHGLSHGHYDKLNINLYDKGNEILTDYGAVRFIGVEQKYGGRYLPENKGYAVQTIAHNTVVADERSHYNGIEDVAGKFHAEKLFSSINNEPAQVISTKEENAYAGIKMQRTVYLLQLPDSRKLLLDIFNVLSDSTHQYDLPFHYNGHLISTSFKYNAYTRQQEPLGNKNGYQFLWKEADADVKDTIAQLTLLNDKTYYTISSLINGPAKLFLTRSGASDPFFNLRHEPAFIIRKKGTNKSFISVLEIHGNFDSKNEFSTGAYSAVQKMETVQNDDNYTIIRIMLGGKELLITQCNEVFDSQKTHTAGNVSWKGAFMVKYDGTILNK